MGDSVDSKLAQTQDEILKRGLEPSLTILPQEAKVSKAPKDFNELLETSTKENVCDL